MSKSSVQQVIQKAVSDAAFRRQLQREPAKALAGFDLTADERTAVTGSDPTRLTALGVDQRMSKAFALGVANDASAVTTGDAGTSGSAAFIDEPTGAANAGLVSDNTDGSPSLFSDDAAGASATIVADSTDGSAAAVDADGTTFDASLAAAEPAELGSAAAVDAGGGTTFDASLAAGEPAELGAVIPGDATAGATADLSTAGDLNTFDAGVVDPNAVSQFNGTQVTIDDGQPTTAFESDPGATFGTDTVITDDGASGDAPMVDATPTFDGHVTIDDGSGDSLTQ